MALAYGTHWFVARSFAGVRLVRATDVRRLQDLLGQCPVSACIPSPFVIVKC
jgi:hypothetical protein